MHGSSLELVIQLGEALRRTDIAPIGLQMGAAHPASGERFFMTYDISVPAVPLSAVHSACLL